MSGGARAVTVRPAARLHGATDIPGDKSISHRALIVSALAAGRSIIHRPGMGADVRSTRRCLEALGVHIEAWDEGLYVDGCGFDDLAQPAKPLDCGNSQSRISSSKSRDDSASRKSCAVANAATTCPASCSHPVTISVCTGSSSSTNTCMDKRLSN